MDVMWLFFALVHKPTIINAPNAFFSSCILARQYQYQFHVRFLGYSCNEKESYSNIYSSTHLVPLPKPQTLNLLQQALYHSLRDRRLKISFESWISMKTEFASNCFVASGLPLETDQYAKQTKKYASTRIFENVTAKQTSSFKQLYFFSAKNFLQIRVTII